MADNRARELALEATRKRLDDTRVKLVTAISAIARQVKFACEAYASQKINIDESFNTIEKLYKGFFSAVPAGTLAPATGFFYSDAKILLNTPFTDDELTKRAQNALIFLNCFRRTLAALPTDGAFTKILNGKINNELFSCCQEIIALSNADKEATKTPTATATVRASDRRLERKISHANLQNTKETPTFAFADAMHYLAEKYDVKLLSPRSVLAPGKK